MQNTWYKEVKKLREKYIREPADNLYHGNNLLSIIPVHSVHETCNAI